MGTEVLRRFEGLRMPYLGDGLLGYVGYPLEGYTGQVARALALRDEACRE